jgi:hypothetical protein
MPTTLPKGVSETHVSLFDGTNCGIAVDGKPVFRCSITPRPAPARRTASTCSRHKIAGDGQPALSVFGDKPSIDQVQLFVVSKGWRFERLISRQINVNFGERPKEADVLEFLRRLKRSEFGNAQSGSVFLFGHPTYSPPSPPALKN